MHRVDVLARARAKTDMMQPRPALEEARPAIFRGTTRDPEAGAAADTIKFVGFVAHHEGEAQRREQAAIKCRTLGKLVHRQVDMGDTVDFHRQTLVATFLYFYHRWRADATLAGGSVLAELSHIGKLRHRGYALREQISNYDYKYPEYVNGRPTYECQNNSVG